MMRTPRRRWSLWACAALLLSVSACDFADINENPNQSTTATPTTLLPRGQWLIAQNNFDAFALGRFSNLYAQYWTQNQYTDEDRYAFPTARSGSVNTMWNQYYIGMNNLQEMVRLYEASPGQFDAFGAPGNMEAIALILQAYTYQHIADIWGPAPFSQALQGDQAPAAAYDDPRDIYMGVLEMLTRANGLINTGALGPTAGDLIYGGNMARWQRLANSLKMRVAIRIADVMPDVSRAAITEALAAGVFTGNADNARFPFAAAPPYQNPIFTNFQGGRDDWAVAAPLVNYMSANEDPRLAVYADPSDASVSAGSPQVVPFAYGQSGAAANAQYSSGNYSRPGAAVRTANFAGPLMLYDEVLFIQAEAAQRGWISGNAAALYEQAIRASVAYWGVTNQAATNAFVANVPYDANNWRLSIGRQKWVALYMQGVQGWSEWRRLDFGLLTPPAGGSAVNFGRPIAIRMTYPLVEQSLNRRNWTAAMDQFYGGTANDTQGTPVFWDVTN